MDINRMIEGYRSFRETYYAQNRDLFDALANRGQSPKVLMISCSDSRVDPALLFGAEPGELFVIRNVANLVPPYAPDSQYHGTSAALEFAVRSLGVEHIVVLGHAQCGGVRALLSDDRPQESDFVNAWMEIATPARNRARWRAADQPEEVLQRVCEHETVAISLTNLMSFPWIRERVAAGNLNLHGYYFDLQSGELHMLDKGEGAFRSVTEEKAFF